MNKEDEMQAKRETYGQYLVINWTKDNDDANVENIAAAIRELLKSARACNPYPIESSIYIVIKGAEVTKKDDFGIETHYIGDEQMTVGLRYEGITWKQETEETED
jgi:hypothetical protein